LAEADVTTDGKDNKDSTQQPPCAMCGKPAGPAFLPFCSKRCKLRDLARWLGGDEPYVIPGEPLSALVDENGEPLVDLEEIDLNNVVYADFGQRTGEDDN
jgi:endogenous inhibitor of DNA gyrase (YacG/DUF329 family)